jgi:hypothetical protein
MHSATVNSSICYNARSFYDYVSHLLQWTQPFCYSTRSFYDFVSHSRDHVRYFAIVLCYFMVLSAILKIVAVNPRVSVSHRMTNVSSQGRSRLTARSGRRKGRRWLAARPCTCEGARSSTGGAQAGTGWLNRLVGLLGPGDPSPFVMHSGILN